uniref:Maturase K n=7 Tax=Nardus TaxID=15679 RepID=MATK_NARST|nr:maturase K [Nardus stricta]Q9MUZ7.1 RecName: Full=Maturase K; AltName: Full=Intron maturase [Nardus stricta]CCC54677.1 maturase K [Nardus sp. Hodkinson s.n.]AAF66181.1 maturase [Nardus stricta]ACF32485.1 maturase K [Nardus stricta]ARQ27980.1 maturase K [Nardus stricta]
MEKFEGYSKKHKFRHQYFVYPLLFQEYIYAFAHDYGLKGSESVEIISCNNKKFSSLLVKRLIIRMYQQNFWINSVNHPNQDRLLDYNNYFYSEFYSQILSEGFAIVVEIPFSLRELSCSKEKEIPKFQNLRSIHSIFPFLEDKFLHLDYLSHIEIPYPIHLEILVQLLQYRLQDVPSLHFLRFFLNYYSNWNSLITSMKSIFLLKKENKRLFRFLYNSYVSEYEFFLLFLRKQSSRLPLTSSGTFLERIHFCTKMEHFGVRYPGFFRKTIWFFMDPLMHYVRYQGKAILASKGARFLRKKWKCYLVNFWQYSFSFWIQPRRIQLNKLANSCFDFLGYLSSVPQSPLLVRNQMLENSFLITTRIKKFDTIAPAISLIGSLSKAQFCTGSGHPISKPIWTDLSDWDILDRFGRICRNLFHYHSGSSKKQTLYRVKYILRLSCARTLARKHKSTVRTFMQRLGSVFLEEFFTEEEQVFSLMFTKTTHFSFRGSHSERIWYFDILRINDLVKPFN